MVKILRWKCDQCGATLSDTDGGIHIKDMRQDPKGHITGIIDGPFDFCKKDCLLDFFARYQFR